MPNLPNINHPCTGATALEQTHLCCSEHQCTAPYVIGAGAAGAAGGRTTGEDQSELHGCSTSNVADRITQLLERVAKLTTADKLKPTMFDARGEAHANRIAAADERQSRQAR